MGSPEPAHRRVVIGVGVFDQRTVNRQSILGAICLYLLIGMLFTFVYGAVAVLGLGDFVQRTDGTPSLRLYFSYMIPSSQCELARAVQVSSLTAPFTTR